MHTKLSTIILTISIIIFGFQNGLSEPFTCSDRTNIKIVADDDHMVGHVCEATAKALDFLGRYGLHLDQPITIMIVEETIDSNGYIAVGSYDRQSDVISIMSFSALMSGPSPHMYGQPLDLEHYQGAVAHEVAHAVFYHNSSKAKGQLTNATQEYLAHAVQLGTLSYERRRQIIAENDVGPWESGDSISEIYMALNPTGFAVKSYLHLTQLEDPRPFIEILLKHSWFYVSVP